MKPTWGLVAAMAVCSVAFAGDTVTPRMALEYQAFRKVGMIAEANGLKPILSKLRSALDADTDPAGIDSMTRLLKNGQAIREQYLSGNFPEYDVPFKFPIGANQYGKLDQSKSHSVVVERILDDTTAIIRFGPESNVQMRNGGDANGAFFVLSVESTQGMTAGAVMPMANAYFGHGKDGETGLPILSAFDIDEARKILHMPAMPPGRGK